MTDRAYRVAMMLAALVGLAMGSHVNCGASVAHAQPRKFPAKTHCMVPVPGSPAIALEDFTLDEPLFGFTRDMVNKANATATKARRLEGDVLDLTRQVSVLTSPDPRWRVAARWFVTGAVVVGAFILGTTI